MSINVNNMFARWRIAPFAGLLPIVLTVNSASAQKRPVVDVLRENARIIRVVDGKLNGDGADLIASCAQRAQIVAVAEEHNVGANAEFTAALFRLLHDRFGFNYIALEQGLGAMDGFSRAVRARGEKGGQEFARTYPTALTFATDEEIAMLGAIAATSSAKTLPLWGVDQEYAVTHILTELRRLARSVDARAKIDALLAKARPYDASRAGDTLFMQIADPADFEGLQTTFGVDNKTANDLIDLLRTSNRIYRNNNMARKGALTGYENMREREQLMKSNFMHHYRAALAAGDQLPRVLLKLGHWHVLRGISPGNVPTFGNFAAEFATSNGMESCVLSTYVVGSSEAWRNTTGPLQAASDSVAVTVIDLRAMRPLAQAGRIEGLSDSFKATLFKADIALVIPGGKTGTYTLAR